MEVTGHTSEPNKPAGTAASSDPTQISAMVDLLLTVGYIDGLFHHHEQAFVRQYIDSVLLGIKQSAPPEEHGAIQSLWGSHFKNLYKRLDAEIAVLADEVASADADNYVPTRLKVRALGLFRGLAEQDQKTAMELIDGLIHADGTISPEEQDLYDELSTYFVAVPTPAPISAQSTQEMHIPVAAPGPAGQSGRLLVNAPVHCDLAALSHPLLDPLEQTYSPLAIERNSQVEWDYQLTQQAIAQWQRQRTEGLGRLTGLNLASQIPAGSRFLDGYVYVNQPAQPLELIVLGDLHGCYSCLKAAVLQSNFIERAWAHQWDPQTYPDVKLVLLGDYIDRGKFSFDGVLRAALHLFVSMPDHVILLRGNHEFLTWIDDHITSGVHPAEALASIAPHVPVEMLEAYRLLFEHMPTSFICDRSLFVHAGIPRDDTFADHYRDLSSLNDPKLRFQMMWSDPVQNQHIPVELQKKNPRFAFGHDQFRAFMERTGLQVLVRGHEKINSGFEVVYDMGEHHLLNLFSAGGHNNSDLPETSSYRKVTPMALTMQYGYGAPIATPWPLQYHTFNYPPHNGLYRPHPVLEFKYA